MFLIWTAIGTLASVRHFFFMPEEAGMGQLTLLLVSIALYYPWIFLTPVVFRIEARFPLGTARRARNLAFLAMFSVPIFLLASALMLGTFLVAWSALRAPLGKPLSEIPWYKELPVARFIYWGSAAGGYFTRTVFQLREQERKAARLDLEKSQLEAGLNQAQLEVLRARLNPHFLFNSLQNISVMTKRDPQSRFDSRTTRTDCGRASNRRLHR